MALSIDHIVISVHDVYAAIETYHKLGFTAFYGGKHASGLTQNGLVVFDDGSYLELIGLVEPATQEGEFYDLLRTDGSEGYTGFALLSDQLEADSARIQAGGVHTSEIKPGSRTRSDGAVIEWKMCSLDNGRNPFVIMDQTARLLRVPAEGSNIQHSNTALGIAEVHILVADLDTVIPRYTAISGASPTIQEQRVLFPLASGMIVLSRPADDAEQAYLDQCGSVPYKLTLIGMGDAISPEHAHGARFVFTG